jgi:hypothetical protein
MFSWSGSESSDRELAVATSSEPIAVCCSAAIARMGKQALPTSVPTTNAATEVLRMFIVFAPLQLDLVRAFRGDYPQA